MGINFLDVKRVEFRMELLELARAEIEEDQKHTLDKDKRETLIEKIDNNLMKLEDKKQSILDASETKNKEKLLLEKLISS